MSGTYKKLKKIRAHRSTHFFEEDVVMTPINDPIFPNHPGSPKHVNGDRKLRFHDIHFRNLGPGCVPGPAPAPGNRPAVVTSSKSSFPDLDEFEELPFKMQLSQGVK